MEPTDKAERQRRCAAMIEGYKQRAAEHEARANAPKPPPSPARQRAMDRQRAAGNAPDQEPDQNDFEMRRPADRA